MTPRRLYGPVVLAMLAAGGLGFFAASRTWATATLTSDGLPPTDLSVSGSDAQPLVGALAVIVITAALAILAAGPRLRRCVGVLTIAVAVLGIVVAPRPGGSALRRAVMSAAEESPAFTGAESVGAISSTPWYFVAVAACVVAFVLGAITLRWAPAWPTMSSRYDAPSARAARPSTISDADMWKAMDEGHDPTE